MSNKYLIVIEKASDGSYSEYLPYVPGCVSTGGTLYEVTSMIREALEFHFEGLRGAR